MNMNESSIFSPAGQEAPQKPTPEKATLAGMQVPALLQTARLCAHLGINSSTLWRWIATRHFPRPLCIGPKVRMWKTVEVEQWLDSQAQAGGQS